MRLTNPAVNLMGQMTESPDDSCVTKIGSLNKTLPILGFLSTCSKVVLCMLLMVIALVFIGSFAALRFFELLLCVLLTVIALVSDWLATLRFLELLLYVLLTVALVFIDWLTTLRFLELLL
jgi:hypothetical protein